MNKAQVEKLKEWKKAMDELNRLEIAERRKATWDEKLQDIAMLFRSARQLSRHWPEEPTAEEVERWVQRREKLARTLGI